MKKIYATSALALTLCATGAVAGVSFSGFDMATVKAGLAKKVRQVNIEEYSGTPTLEQLKAFAATRTRADEPAGSELPKGVTVEKLIDMDFSDWTAGTMEDPDNVNVGSDEALFDKFFGADSGWSVFQAYQAGGNMYLGFDEIGNDGPGYFMTPTFDFTDPKVAYRLCVTAMNVNANSQDQGLQAFFMNEEPSGDQKGQMIAASTLPMKYNEWSECVWTGQVVNPDYNNVRAMVFGWQGKVLIKNVTFEKLIYPLPSVSGIKISYNDGLLTSSWTAVEGASEYKATVTMVVDNESVEIGSAKVTEPTASFDIALNEQAERYFVNIVALNEAGEESYPSSGYAELEPEAVGDALALPASNISAEGFTANWEAISSAARTLVFPVQNHKATAAEEYLLLHDDFSNVPENNNEYNPAQVIPMLGMGNIDLMMSRAGWSTDACVFFRLMPEMPCLVLTNMFAAYGMPGYLMSPVYDLSVGGGKVNISAMAFSGGDDAVLTFFLVDADTYEPYASNEAEITTEGVIFDLSIEGGRPNSRIMFYMTDSAEEEMVAIPEIAISVDLNEGEEITAPLPTAFVPAPAVSYDFDYPVDADNSYSYSVQGIFKDLYGAVSEPVEVKADGNGVATAIAGLGKASLNGGILTVANPEGKNVAVVSADGKVLSVSADKNFSLNVTGTVIVRIGDKAFKFVR